MFSGPHDTFPGPPYPFHGEIFNHFLDKRTCYISWMINLRGTPAYAPECCKWVNGGSVPSLGHK